ncbi:LCP family glycopolymer transferase [Oribacterium sp. HCP3S3_B9]|uniref:LCP family protein n=1 Tax=Oribacterium sp. HCP3S3_B9 TaxID=3438946 RepID=UPI003F8AFFFF
MALDSGKETRRPHTQAEAEAEQRALEDRIVNDKQMAGRLMDKAMNPQSGNAATARRSNPYLSEMEAERRAARAADGTARTPHSAGTTSDAYSTTGSTGTRPSDTPGTRPTTGTTGARPASRSDARPRRTTPVKPQEAQPGVRQLNSIGEGQFDADYERRMRDKKKKARRTRIITMVIVELLTLICIFGFGFVYRYMHMTADVAFDVSKVRNDNIDISQKQKMSGYWTVAVFGVDSRNGDVGKGANADVQIIANVNMGTGDITLTSVYRDTYLNIGKGDRYSKSNAAYAEGGPEQAVAMLNKNLDLDIENYVTFNWKAVADVIDLLGGVDIDVSKAAFYYMNAYIHETCLKSGISAQNPAAMYIKKAGPQHLNGVQAVAYARLRYMDSDFERTKRQREVISQCLDLAKKTDLATLTKIIDTVLPQVAFNIDTADIIELAKGISRYNIRESVGFPKDLKDQMMGKKGACVIPATLESNVVWLHSILFADENYTVSDAVKRYSQKISDDSGYYASHKETEESDKKFTKSDEDEIEKTKAETDENGETIKKPKTDKDGYLIKGIDADGKYIYETDADGNKIKANTETKANETKESETDADGNVIKVPKTDKNGYLIKGVDKNGKYIYETDAEGNKIKADTETTKSDETKEGETKESETDEGEIIEGPTKETKENQKETKENSKDETKESKKDNSSETKESQKETIEEPGKTPENSYDGPGGSSSNHNSSTAGPGSSSNNSSEGPGSSHTSEVIPGGPGNELVEGPGA